MLLVPDRVELSQYSSESVNIVITIVHESPEDGKPRNYGDDLANGLFIDDLVLEIRVHKYSYSTPPKANVYIKIGYSSPYFVDLDRAEKQLKTLKTINSRLDKINQEWGFTEEPDQIAIRFAKAIGAKEYFKQTRNGGYSYTESEYHRGVLADLQNAVKYLVQDAKRLIVPE
jgi:hypothetical protein